VHKKTKGEIGVETERKFVGQNITHKLKNGQTGLTATVDIKICGLNPGSKNWQNATEYEQ
jgi:hypothetical protein